MVTEQTRHDIWDQMLDVARLVRYYEALADKHRLYYFLIRGTLVVSALIGSAGLLNILDFFPQDIQVFVTTFAGFVLALVTAWDIVANHARKAAVLHAISKECSLLEIEWKDLWADIYSHQSGDSVIRKKNKQLAYRLTEVTAWAGDADIRENRKLNEKCESTTHHIMREKYVA